MFVSQHADTRTTSGCLTQESESNMRKKRALANRQSVWTVSDDDGSVTTAGGKLPITVNGLASPTTIDILNPSAVHISVSRICVGLVRTTYSMSYFRNGLIYVLIAFGSYPCREAARDSSFYTSSRGDCLLSPVGFNANPPIYASS